MKKILMTKLCIGLLLAVLSQVLTAKTIYVDASAVGSDNGSSWEDAYIYLQDALTEADDNDEIHVAASTYCPDKGTGYTPGDREASFVFKNAVIIYGGYPAGGGDRDCESNQTILSGDLLGDDDSLTEVDGLMSDPTRADNSYHVLVGQYCGSLTGLNGITVSSGQADGADELAKGAGWYNTTNSSPTVTNCIFTRNAAKDYGGGLCNSGLDSIPEIHDCDFIGNFSGISGGGISCESTSTEWGIRKISFSSNAAGESGGGLFAIYCCPTVENCVFLENKSIDGAGLLCQSNSFNSIISDCYFKDNLASRNGGGICVLTDNLIVEDCVFTFNIANDGGGIYSGDNCNVTLNLCKIYQNNAVNGGGVFCNDNESNMNECEFVSNIASSEGGAIYNASSTPEIVDTLFFENISNGSGGAMYNYWSHTKSIDCRFLANKTETGSGGAIFNYAASSPEYYNCIFSANESVTKNGGAIYNNYYQINRYGLWYRYPCSPKIVNSSFSRNSAYGEGGGIFSSDSRNSITIINSILWKNDDTAGSHQDLSAQVRGSTYYISYSCISGIDIADGVGNINTDPLFLDPDGFDFIYGNLDDDLRLSPGSPCIDAGDGSALPIELQLDLQGFQRCMDDPFTPDTGIYPGPEFDPNGAVDMGAYEFVQDVVYFECPILQKAVEDELAKQDIYPPITETDMLVLTYLKANSLGIASLVGLQTAINLETTYLYSNVISDMTPLEDLEKLVYVHLANNNISEIPDLSNWTKIKYLYLYGNPISDISNLAYPDVNTLVKLDIHGIDQLSLEAYQVHIPAIKANNLGIELIYDYGCDPMLPADINKDCIIDIQDFTAFCEDWLNCTHIYTEMCN